MNLVCSIAGSLGRRVVRRAGGVSEIPVSARWASNRVPFPGAGHCQRVSLTGAVSSQTVTEEFEGHLSTDGNRAPSARAEGGLTARGTPRADAKAGPSDPAVARGSAVAQRTKGTLGITG